MDDDGYYIKFYMSSLLSIIFSNGIIIECLRPSGYFINHII